MGCAKQLVPVPVSKVCYSEALTEVVIPEDWSIQWLAKNSKSVVEAFRIQQKTIQCYKGEKNEK